MIGGHHSERPCGAAERGRSSPGGKLGLQLLHVVRCVGVRLRERLAMQLRCGSRRVQR
jgi:hypothetical protein